MTSDHNLASVSVLQRDYPAAGLDATGWFKLSPHDTNVWGAYSVAVNGEAQANYFLGFGSSDLTVEWIEFGNLALKVLDGFAYAVDGSGNVTCLPCNGLGYESIYVAEKYLVFAGSWEILAISRDGTIRREPEAAYDRLEALGVGQDQIFVRGVRNPPDEEDWSISVIDLPEWSPLIGR